MEVLTSRLFRLGTLQTTPGALCAGAPIAALLRRHAAGDWGDVCESDAAANDAALLDGSRLFSAYETPAGRIWIITEADRSLTTALLPSEY